LRHGRSAAQRTARHDQYVQGGCRREYAAQRGDGDQDTATRRVTGARAARPHAEQHTRHDKERQEGPGQQQPKPQWALGGTRFGPDSRKAVPDHAGA
jgi:hypothetical protein